MRSRSAFPVIPALMIIILALASCDEPGGPLEASEPPTPSILSVSTQDSDPRSSGRISAVHSSESETDRGGVSVIWTQCPDEDFAWYTLFRSQTPGISSDLSLADTSIVFGEVYATSWTDNGVSSGGTFYYAVRTTDSEDLSSWSNEESIDLPQDPPPTPSVLTALSTGDDTWAQITLEWSGCPDADFHSYELYRSLDPDITGDPDSAELLAVMQSSGDTSYEDNDVIGDETYHYAIRTWDQGEQFSWSNEVDFTTPYIEPLMTVFFIDPGHGSLSGDATLIRTPGNSFYLIDGGARTGSWSCGLDRILPLLDSLGVTELEGIVGSHPHADHIGGLIAVLEALPVGTVWDSGYPYTTQTYQDYLEAIDENGADYVTPRRGDILEWDDEITVECIHPVDPLDGDEVNNASVTLRITYDDVSFMFTGDLETDGGEEVILLAHEQGYIDEIEVDVLKVGHHGSATSTSQEWLEGLDPDYAAIEVGAGNPYGHPHDTVISRLENYGIEIYRTDQDGTFIFTTNGTDIDIFP